MWNKPSLMTAVADLLFVAASAALLVAAMVWGAHLPFFPLREIVVLNELKEIPRSEIKLSLNERLQGNFFSIDLEAFRIALEKMPWVRRADVRRAWPLRIEVMLEEQVPLAIWGDSGVQFINPYGEIFSTPEPTARQEPLPVLQGPPGLTVEMLAYYQEAEKILKPLGRVPRILNVSERLAVQVGLDDGMLIELGRPQAKAPLRERLTRFAEYYPSILVVAKQRPSVVDTRYPNGFALRINAAPTTDKKGKP